MNHVIETILNHRSIREYDDRPLSEEQIRLIVEAAQAASTGNFIQAYTIIGVKDLAKKQKLAELSGNQSYVETNGHFFVFCADLYRHELAAELEDTDITEAVETTEKFMVAVIDATLAAQNAAIAAESMGLGICYIGGLRNHLDEVNQVLKIPKRVVPLFGMSVGYPLQTSAKKPRLPFEHVYHENEYNQDQIQLTKQLTEYNQIIKDYYEHRTDGKRTETWTEQMTKMLSTSTRQYMKDYIEKQGFNKK